MMRASFERVLWMVLLGLVSAGENRAQTDVHPILGHSIGEIRTVFDGLKSYTVVGDYLFVEAIPVDTTVQEYYRPRQYWLIDPATGATVWSRNGLWRCYPTCVECAAPCMACESISLESSDTVNCEVVTPDGDLLFTHTTIPRSYRHPNCDIDDPPSQLTWEQPWCNNVLSSPGGQYFFHWCEGRSQSGPLFDRSGTAINEWSYPMMPFDRDTRFFGGSLLMILAYDRSKDQWWCGSQSAFFRSVNADMASDTTEVTGTWFEGIARMGPDGRLAFPPNGGAAVFAPSGGPIQYIGPDLEIRWSTEVPDHNELPVFSEDGRFISVRNYRTGKDEKTEYHLVLLRAFDGEQVWDVELDADCGRKRPCLGSVYFARSVVRTQSGEATHLIEIDSVEGAIVAHDSLPVRVDVFATDDGYVTVRRESMQSSIIFTDTWRGR